MTARHGRSASSADAAPETITRELSLSATAVREAGEAGETRIPVALSSETAVLRRDWYTGEQYYEVLSHAAEDIDMSYARDGLPFVLSHDTYDQYGIVEDIAVGDDGVLRGMLKLSASERAQEIGRDIRDGIRKKVSVGYRLTDDYTQGGEEGQVPTRRYRNWRPLELSAVAIPADYAVGYGRSERPAHTTARSAKEIAVEPKDSPAPAGASAGVADHARELVALATQHKLMDRLPSWLDKGVSPAAAREEIANHYRQKFEASERAAAERKPVVELNDREERSYSVVEVARALYENKVLKGFEREVSDEIATKLGRDSKGYYIPSTIKAQRAGALTADQARTLLSVGAGGATNKGQSFVYETYGGSIIELLRSMLVTERLGARILTGLRDDLSFPLQSASVTASWLAEDANPTATSAVLGERTMTPKQLAAATGITRRLLAQSTPDIENLVREDIAAVHARAWDLAALNGAGTGGVPRGIAQTAGIGSVVGGVNGGQPTYENVVALQREVAIDNAMIGRLGYCTHPGIAARLMLTQQFTGTNGVPVWTGSMIEGQVAGLRAIASTQVPSALTKGTSTDTAHLIFGDWSQLLIGEWGAMELLRDPFVNGPSQVRILSYQLVDVLVRQPESFAAMLDARP